MCFSLLSHTSHSYCQAVVQKLGKGAQHAKLMYEEFYRQGTLNCGHPAFNNAKELAEQIKNLTGTELPLVHRKVDDGSTGKFLLRTADNLETESVIIPMKAGATLCVSSQVGCKLGCTFCETGRMGLLRNLTAAEIVSQLYVAKHLLGSGIRNVVFMGMGEPFDNYDEVIQAARIINDPYGFGIGQRHITISTSGLVEGIYRLIEEKDFTPNLAVSLTAPTNELRGQLMPINKRHPLEELYKAMLDYNKATKKQVLVAYVMLDGVNDSDQAADQLAHYLKGLDVKINLIPYNSQSRDRFSKPSEERMSIFAKRLRQLGYKTLLRLTKGSSIMAACGQLGNLALRKQLYSSLPKENRV